MGQYCLIIETLEDDLNKKCNLRQVDNFLGHFYTLKMLSFVSITVEIYGRDFVHDT